MSEQSQGPGWWQASDGKWYSPEQAPGYVPAEAAAPPPAPGYTVPDAAGPGGGSGTAKVVAIVAVVALLAGGAAFALTRGGSGGERSVKAFCDAAKGLEKNQELSDSFTDPAKIDEAVAQFDKLTKVAPAEIESDMNVIDDAFKKVASAMKSAGSDSDKQFGAIFGALAQLDQAKLKTAGEHLDAFAHDKCGLDLSLDSSSSSDSDSSSSFDFSSFLSSFDTDFSTDSTGS